MPNLEPCPVLKAGQVFYATNTCQKGMCDAAWRMINPASVSGRKQAFMKYFRLAFHIRRWNEARWATSVFTSSA